MEQELTFAALEAKLEGLPQHPNASTDMPRRSRWGFAIGFASGALGLLAGNLLPSNHLSTALIAGTFLVIELIAVGVSIAAQLPQSWPTFAGERREAAEELDFDLPHHQDLIRWIQDHPRDQVQQLSDYASYRLERLRERMPLLTGGIEKLGALPVFIALYIQFKDAHWPPHPSWIEIILMLALVLGYWMSLLQINVRFRMQTYEALLKKALRQLT